MSYHLACRWATLILGITIFFVGNVSCASQPFQERYKQAVESGFSLIPQAEEIEKLLGEADHFIQGDGKLWNTEVFFGGRYKLTMQVPIEVNSSFSKVTKVSGPPSFYFWEIREVTVKNGALGGEYNGESQRTFGVKEWQQIVDRKGDFSPIEIHLKQDSPIPKFDEYKAGWRHDRIQVRPPKKNDAAIER